VDAGIQKRSIRKVILKKSKNTEKQNKKSRKQEITQKRKQPKQVKKRQNSRSRPSLSWLILTPPHPERGPFLLKVANDQWFGGQEQPIFYFFYFFLRHNKYTI